MLLLVGAVRVVVKVEGNETEDKCIKSLREVGLDTAHDGDSHEMSMGHQGRFCVSTNGRRKQQHRV